MGFNDPVTPIMRQILGVYDIAITIGVVVVTLVFGGLLRVIFHRGIGGRSYTDAPKLEAL